ALYHNWKPSNLDSRISFINLICVILIINHEIFFSTISSTLSFFNFKDNKNPKLLIAVITINVIAIAYFSGLSPFNSILSDIFVYILTNTEIPIEPAIDVKVL